MKKLYLILMFVGVVLSGYAQRKAPAADIRTITIHLTDGSTIERPVWEVEKITFGTSENTLESTAPEAAVDLGLSVQWAPFNLGAANASEPGFLVGWGDVTGRNHSTDLKYYPTLTPDGHIVNTSYDLAKVMWEDKWRMPTDGEINELITQCDWEWTEQDGVNGYLVKSRTNENSIFLPVTGVRTGDVTGEADMGYYWSGMLSENKTYAQMLGMTENTFTMTEMERYLGMAIRPVYGDYKQKVEVAINENGVTKGTETVSVPLIFTGTLSYVSDYGVAFATSESTLNVQGSSRVNKSGVPNETTTITVGGLESNTTYYFKAYAVTEGNFVESNVITVTTDAKFPIPDAVDLGLSVKWAKWNMGASSEYEVGGYYGWGDPTGDMMSWTSSDYANGYTGTKIYGDEKYDIATANWGKGWRLPKKEEVEELMEKSTITATTQNGVAGYMLTCNGQSIFLPKGGYEYSNKFYYDNYSMYWTGETDSQLHPYELAIYSKTQYAIVANNNKATHMLIRPVYDGDGSGGGGTSSNAYDKYAVDLGLSSLWSSVNLGATKNTAAGKFYAWGETKANTSFKKEEYDYYDASSDAFVSIGNEISNTEYDAVKAAWGGKWHMPTYFDFQELNERCTWEKTTVSGVNCYKVTGPSGKFIYLPMTGYYSSVNTEPAYATTKARYWAGTLYTLPTADPTPNVYAYAYNLDINTDPQDSQPNKFYRYFGAVIRPVRTK